MYIVAWRLLLYRIYYVDLSTNHVIPHSVVDIPCITFPIDVNKVLYVSQHIL